MTSIPTIDDLIAFVREGDVDIEALLRKKYAEVTLGKAKAKMSAEAKSVYEASAEYYIEHQMNCMMEKSAKGFADKPFGGSASMKFVRNVEWDEAEFVTKADNAMLRLLNNLNRNKHITFSADMGLEHDEENELHYEQTANGRCGCNGWWVRILWEV
jgi:hypothetical protein